MLFLAENLFLSFFMQTSEINSRKNTTEVFVENEDYEHKTETRGPTRRQRGCTTRPTSWLHGAGPVSPRGPSRRVLLRASIYTGKNPNPRGMELFVNQSIIAVENKDCGTRLVSLFTPKRGISPPSSSSSSP
jgi:hypothetical protein